MNIIFHEEGWKIWLTNCLNPKVCFRPSDAARDWINALKEEQRSVEINKAIECYLRLKAGLPDDKFSSP